MMKYRFARFYFSKCRMLKLFSLFFIQKIFYALQIPCNDRLWQQTPLLADRYILETTILLCRIIDTAPASNMRNRFSSCPIRIILVPGYNTTLFCWLPKYLVMPETYRHIAEQLTGSNQEAR